MSQPSSETTIEANLGDLHILVDADSCPVKDEVFKVALRHLVSVSVVANSYLRVPTNRLFKRVHVSSGFDAADDFIVSKAGERTIVVTSDILLAERCLKAQSVVIAPNGIPFTVNSIGNAVATRALYEDLRASGVQLAGVAPFAKKDRSKFLSSLHDAIVKLKAKQKVVGSRM